jgi:hypothetical protein
MSEDPLDQFPPVVPEEEEDCGDTDAATVRARRFAVVMNMLNSLFGAGIPGIPHSLPY